MATFAELINELVTSVLDEERGYDKIEPIPRSAEEVRAEIDARVTRLQTQIDDPDGADELPMVVLEFLDGEPQS